MQAKPYPALTEAVMARLWAKTRLEPGGCISWTGGVDPASGYGKFYLAAGRATQAHRVSLAWAEGRNPLHLTVDHLCQNTRCVNPSHLEFVTQAENNLRRALRTTHCPQGHEYTPANTYRRPSAPNNRACRTCRNARKRAARAPRLLAI